MNNKILASVIIYNPGYDVIDNILTYNSFFEGLLIVDNSDIENISLQEKLIALPKTKYINNSGNLGIATALNIAAAFAFENEYSWLLTMDQDSFFAEANIMQLVNDMDDISKQSPNIGILTPYHKTQTLKQAGPARQGIFKIKTCMTSGNLINLEVWKAAGGFLEKLFIDYVDHEYCLRIRKNGALIWQTNNATLSHALGNSKTFTFFGADRTTSHHNYIRRYYLTRNRLYFIKQYLLFDPGICFKELYNFFAEGVKMLLNEDDKKRKIKSILNGLKDFAIGRYGKYGG